mmetsp:Transcript_45160/g.73698  ORF Transcript_45160/g.73698 Transcript_45160/m.73698 type:complete len:135 (-) Transcript_45160:184-588(-)
MTLTDSPGDSPQAKRQKLVPNVYLVHVAVLMAPPTHNLLYKANQRRKRNRKCKKLLHRIQLHLPGLTSAQPWSHIHLTSWRSLNVEELSPGGHGGGKTDQQPPEWDSTSRRSAQLHTRMCTACSTVSSHPVTSL